MKNKFVVVLFVCLLISVPFSARAYWVWSPETGKFVNPEGAVQDSSDEQYDFAMKFYKERDLKEAAEQLKNLLKKFPNSRIAPEAQYRLGTIYEEQGDFMKAFGAYKVILESYPQSERLNEVIEREFRIGNVFLSGKKAKLMGLEILPSLPRAVEIFQHIVKYSPYSDFGDKAQFHLALAHKKWGHYDDAVKSFQDLIDHYPQSQFIPQARLAMAETSYARSAVEVGDQRALDEASKQVDQFLTRYPETNASEKAAGLRQEIDERNAEKNYRIGSYYERENYIESALIYYSDTAARYPRTRWGVKAADKLKTLKEPAKHLSEQEDELARQKKKLEAEIQNLPSNSEERKRLERGLSRLNKTGRQLKKETRQTLTRRHADLARREKELKEKFKTLEKKKKLAKKNPSEDFKRVIERWEASLQTEKAELVKERQQLKDWNQTPGLGEKKIDLFPFRGEDLSDLEKIQRLDAKKMYRISSDKKSLLEEKESLYKMHDQLVASLERLESTGEDETDVARDAKLQAQRMKLEALQKELDEKKAAYEKAFGRQDWASWAGLPARWGASSTHAVAGLLDKSFSKLNPFDSKDEKGNLREQKIQGLLEERMHLQEKISAEKNLIQTLRQSFDEELALREERKLASNLQSSEQPDVRKLRQSIKGLEKKIRAAYQDIENHHKTKKKIVADLENTLKEEKSRESFGKKVERLAAAPAVASYRVTKAFLFGLPNQEVELSNSAKKLSASSAEAERARELRKAIELESTVIDAKNREIDHYQKELEIQKAKASLAGGYKFRSAIARVPYVFMGEAVQSARRLIPKKERQEILVNRLNDETQKLEKLKLELQRAEAEISKESQENLKAKAQAKATISAAGAPSGSTIRQDSWRIRSPQYRAYPKNQSSRGTSASEDLKSGIQKIQTDRKKMKAEIRNLAKDIEIQESLYARQRAVSKSQAATQKKAKSHGAKNAERLRGEIESVEARLAKLIAKEGTLEGSETGILEKRIEEIDRAVQKVNSNAAAQDFLTERQRIEARLGQIKTRRDFLSKESGRLQTQSLRKVA